MARHDERRRQREELLALALQQLLVRGLFNRFLGWRDSRLQPGGIGRPTDVP